MALFNRLLRKEPKAPGATHLLLGHESLAIVGESHHQSALRSICGRAVGDEVQHSAVAVLVPEPQNPHDPNAIAVHVDGRIVGHLDRATAVRYGPGVRDLMARHGKHIALHAVIAGGGYRDDGPRMLGVWLRHDPRDFGLAHVGPAAAAVRAVSTTGTLRTGFTEAWMTDVDDESYDLSWYSSLPVSNRSAVVRLRELLAEDPDPIDRHFQFSEMEARLYRCREEYEAALDEYDEACRQHDAEMERICQAFRAKWGKIPMLETYRQMAIRQQKKGDWRACLWWVERGLQLYGNVAARQDAVEDLRKRRDRALVKLRARRTGS